MNRDDPRALRSRQKLVDSLLTLTLEKGYGRFTVRALTRHANVGYATFFRHFKTIDDLLTDILLSAYKELTGAIVEQDTLFNEALVMYRFVSQRPRIYRVFYSLPPEHPIRAYIREASVKLILQLWQERAVPSVPLALSIDFLLQCADLLIHWYLDHLDDYTPEDIATMHFDLIIKGEHSDLSLP